MFVKLRSLYRTKFRCIMLSASLSLYECHSVWRTLLSHIARPCLYLVTLHIYGCSNKFFFLPYAHLPHRHNTTQNTTKLKKKKIKQTTEWIENPLAKQWGISYAALSLGRRTRRTWWTLPSRSTQFNHIIFSFTLSYWMDGHFANLMENWLKNVFICLLVPWPASLTLSCSLLCVILTYNLKIFIRHLAEWLFNGKSPILISSSNWGAVEWHAINRAALPVPFTNRLICQAIMRLSKHSA